MSRLPCHKGIGKRSGPGPPRSSANHAMGIANHQRIRTGININSNNAANANHRRRRIPGEIPYVSHDGGKTRYYADRCYLDAPTGLLEYQLEKKLLEKKKKGSGLSTSSNGNVRHNHSHIHNSGDEYCNKCGEIRNDNPPQRPRGTLAPDKAKPPPTTPTRPLFDRAKFINSLDLSAAIVGTYTIGGFDYLSNELPLLFPRSDHDGGGNRKSSRKYVPTLVLHGQKGFSTEKWSAAASASSAQSKLEAKLEESLPMGIRGGGIDNIECSSSQESQSHGNDNVHVQKRQTPEMSNSTKNVDSTDNANAEEILCLRGGGDSQDASLPCQTKITAQYTPPPLSSERKRPCLTYGNVRLKLPKTPKRLRMSKPKPKKEKVSQQYKVGDRAAKSASRNVVEVIVIDSDSDHDDDEKPQKPKDAANNDSVLQIEAAKKLPPPSSTLKSQQTARSTAHENKVQHSRKAMSLPNNAPSSTEHPDWTSSSSSSSITNNRHPIPTTAVAPAAAPASSSNSLKSGGSSPLQQPTAASILTRALGRPQPKSSTMRLISYESGPDSSQESSIMGLDYNDVVTSKSLKPGNDGGGCGQHDNANNNNKNENDNAKTETKQPGTGWGGVKPATVFGGEVFFTQVLPRWCPPSSKSKKRRKSNESANKRKGAVQDKKINTGRNATASTAAAEYSDDEDSVHPKPTQRHTTTNNTENDKDMKSVRGVHHPKFFLLFEKSGSLVVVISTSNLTPQSSMDGSWVQRFEPKESMPRPTYINNRGSSGGGDARSKASVDYGMPSDFGAVLTDFLKKQSEAAEGGSMMPDVFLRRYVAGLSSGLNALADQYRFDEAQVHLVSTVPGDYISSLPKKGHRDAAYKPRISYGPQRVSFVLSRLLNAGHIRSARAVRATTTGRLSGSSRMESDMPWLPPTLVTAKDRLVMQPTSMGGNWTRDELELITQSYLQPHGKYPENKGEHGTTEDGPLERMDIVWPSMDHFDAKRSISSEMWKKHPEEAAAITKRWTSVENKSERGECHVFLSSVAFSKLDRSCISRMALFTPQPNIMPHQSAGLHFKSFCRLLQLNERKSATSSKKRDNRQQQNVDGAREYLSWFMLTSACLSKGAQGQSTPYRDPQTDCMSYSNFELGVLFCSRLVGDNLHDRLYVSDPSHISGCQCGQGKRWYKSRLCGKGSDNNSFLESVKKVHLPVPYQLRPRPYQEDPDSDLMSYTPYMHEVPEGTGCTGNMKLTPLGQQIAHAVQQRG